MYVCADCLTAHRTIAGRVGCCCPAAYGDDDTLPTVRTDGTMPAQRTRDGKGHRAYRRKRESLKRRTREENLPCGYGSPSGWGCGEAIDTTLPRTHRMSFTADHDTALANGGSLAGQVLVPMHLACNSRKGNHAPVEIWEAT